MVGTRVILSALLLCISFSDYFNNCSLNQRRTAMPNRAENARCILLFYFIPQACHTVTNEMGRPGDAETHMNTFGVVSSSHSRITAVLCHWISSPISLPHSGDCLCFVPVAGSNSKPQLSAHPYSCCHVIVCPAPHILKSLLCLAAGPCL